MHGLGVVGAVAGAVPAPLVPAIRVVTQLGDVWFLTAVVALVYWFSPGRLVESHRDGARLVAVALTAFAAVVALKAAIAHHRPAVALIHASGYSLPSGHATGTAAVYFALAMLSPWRTPRERFALAVGLVTLVAATRLALGVHYFLDLVAGAALGATVAVGVLALTERDVAGGFWAATLVGCVGLVTAAYTTDALAVTGTAFGAALAWASLRHSGAESAPPSVPMVILGLVVVGGFGAVALWLDAVDAILITVCSGAGLVALPAVRVQNVSR